MKSFDDLTQSQILVLAISSEEEDGRIYADFAEGLRDDHPDTAKVFSDMAVEEISRIRCRCNKIPAMKYHCCAPLSRRGSCEYWHQMNGQFTCKRRASRTSAFSKLGGPTNNPANSRDIFGPPADSKASRSASVANAAKAP